MKLSIAWIFDHIKGTWTDHDITDLVAQINSTTAETEGVEKIVFNWDDFTIGRVLSAGSDDLVIESTEWKKKVTLPTRKGVQADACFLLKKEGRELRWATLADLHAEKDGLVPALDCDKKALAGDWRTSVDAEDYVIEIDNKSITNRPDLWGHRGFAREVAALLELDMLPEEHFLAEKPIQHYEQKTDVQADWSIDITPSKICTRFAGIEVSDVMHTPSQLWMVARLACVGTRGIDFFVDATNYVLHDVGHPMHAFDADKISNKTIVARQAQSKETLALLDDTTIELTKNDCVIADDKQALSLAGIMGGAVSAVSKTTTKLFLEAAHFDATAIRLSSAEHKKRTDSSVRFEKTLDPNNNTCALLRYLKLLDDAGVTYKSGKAILSVGPLTKEKTITVAHDFIVNRIGATILPDRIESILKKLGFGVQQKDQAGSHVYVVTVPTYRGTKDIGIKEDIVEEVARFFGYTNISPILPQRIMKPHDQATVMCRRACKNHCAYALNMREVFNYALYDENFIRTLGFAPENYAELKNPVSENWRRLVTSLVPHLLKNIAQNAANESRLRFFEWNRTWQSVHEKDIQEHTFCSGIFYERSGTVDFYDCKESVQSLFHMLGMLVTWRKGGAYGRPWMDEHRCAELVATTSKGEQVIGYAGMVADTFITATAQGNAFVFELDCDLLTERDQVEHSYIEPSKYQAVSLDISMFAPYSVTVEMLEMALVKTDARVVDVYLLDLFEKDEWGDKRSITVRCVVQDNEKTMTGDEIESLQKSLHKAVQKHGVEVR